MLKKAESRDYAFDEAFNSFAEIDNKSNKILTRLIQKM